MTALTLCIRYCLLISLFALFILFCVHYRSIDVKFHDVAVVVEINSIQFNFISGLLPSTFHVLCLEVFVTMLSCHY